MTKNILKEIIIILLLTLAIILLLGVLFYDYVPMNKVLPESVEYKATEEIQAALDEKVINDSQEEVILSYEVTSGDLKNYKRSNDYKAGRKNPFAPIVVNNEQVGNTSGGGATGGTTGGSTSSENTTSENSSSGNTTTSNTTVSAGNTTSNNTTNYYPEKGTK